MKITRSDSMSASQGPAEYFTGKVTLQEITGQPYASDLRALVVTFEPGARTAWHTHPHGQLLHIMSGVARVQRAGGKVESLQPGDAVWFEPDERHWHGAGPAQAMAHLAVLRADESGRNATWLEQVTDAEYNGGR